MTTIYVFGSNLAGRHGKGSALKAVEKHGAIMGRGVGRQGNSYAIPTKNKDLKPLPLTRIHRYVAEFLYYVANNPSDTFNVVEIGCGLAGYSPAQIAPMFRNRPENINLPETFLKAIENLKETEMI